MKSIRNIFIAIIATTMSLVHAAPNFELFNKAATPIRFKITSSGLHEEITGFVKSQGKFPGSINSKGTAQITIIPDATGKENKEPSESDYKYSGETYDITSEGKTIYLTWNPAKKPTLYPQTGPLMGFMGKTESGYSLSNNIKAPAIKTARYY